jgi:acyl-CoA reductase-like NAD-dependent aldehyde dehydrogenase
MTSFAVKRKSYFHPEWEYEYFEDTKDEIITKFSKANRYFKQRNKLWPEQTKKALNLLTQYIVNNDERLAIIDAHWTSRSIYELRSYGLKKAVETIKFFLDKYDEESDVHVNTNYNYTSIRSGIGVVAAITPWNDPMVAFAWKVVPALLAGNAVIWKPSENCIESAILIVQQLYSFGIQEDQLQIVLGGAKQGADLVSCRVDGLSFTGSTKTSIAIQRRIGRMIKSNIEAGGKGHVVISESVELHQLKFICTELIHEAYSNQGQICSAPTVVHVPLRLKRDLVDLFRLHSNDYFPGNPLKPTQRIGQLISKPKSIQLNKIIKRNKQNLIMGGQLIAEQGISPTLLDIKDSNNPILRQELFGPILCLMNYQSINSVIEMINSSSYGLANGIYTNNIDECNLFSQECDSGIMHINSWGKDGVGVPFGGIKESGNSKEKCTSSLKTFTYEKVLCGMRL